MRIYQKLLLGFLATGIISAALIGFISYYLTKHSLEKNLHSLLLGTAKSRVDHVNSYLEQSSERLRLVASRTKLRVCLADYLKKPNDKDLDMMRKILNDASDSVPVFDSIAIIGLDGRMLVSTKELIKNDFSQNPQFVTGKNRVGFFIGKDNGKIIITLTGPLTLNSKLLGVLMIKLGSEQLYKITTDTTGLGKSGEIFLVGADGIMLSPSRFIKDCMLEKRAKNPLELEKKREVPILKRYRSYRGDDVLAVAFPVSGMDWRLVAKSGAGEIDELLAPLFNQLIWVFIITLLLIIIVSLCTAWTIARPITELAKLSESIGLGEEEIDLNIKASGEIAQLSTAFSQMLTRLAERRRKLKDEIETRQRIENELEKHQNELEETVKNRSSELLNRNSELESEIERREKIETQLIVAKQDAETANQAKSEFLANISHEIRTPLNVIVGMSKMLNEYNSDSERKQYAIDLGQSAELLSSTVGNILDLAKIESGKLELEDAPFDLRKMMFDLCRIMRFQANQKGLRLIFDDDGQIPQMLRGDIVRLRQIMQNLISNAIKFTENGEVAVKLSLRELSNDQAFLDFAVEDSGIGIPEAKLETIMDKFTQADSSITRKHGGTGLGLPLSKLLVQEMGGKLSVVSEMGSGSVFSFSIHLPVNLQGDLPKQAPIHPKWIRSPEILLVEDNPLNQKVISHYLKFLDTEVSFAKNGALALEKFDEKNFDLIFMDLQMPKMDGYEATIKIRETEGLREDKSSQKVPIIALTAYSMSEEKDKCAKIGIDDLVTKPCDKNSLATVLVKYLSDLLVESNTRAPSQSSSIYHAESSHREESLAIFDINEALKGFDGSHKILDEMLEIFLDLAPKEIKRLNTAFEKGDFDECFYSAHNLKSMPGNIGAMRMQKLVVEIEKASKNKDRSSLINLVPLLLKEYDKLEVILAKELKK